MTTTTNIDISIIHIVSNKAPAYNGPITAAVLTTARWIPWPIPCSSSLISWENKLVVVTTMSGNAKTSKTTNNKKIDKYLSERGALTGKIITPIRQAKDRII